MARAFRSSSAYVKWISSSSPSTRKVKPRWPACLSARKRSSSTNVSQRESRSEGRPVGTTPPEDVSRYQPRVSLGDTRCLRSPGEEPSREGPIFETGRLEQMKQAQWEQR